MPSKHERSSLASRIKAKLDRSRSRGRDDEALPGAARLTTPELAADASHSTTTVVTNVASSTTSPPATVTTTSKPLSTPVAASVPVQLATTVSTEPQISGLESGSRLLSLEEERTRLWKEAFEQLRKEKPGLLENYEAVLADVSEVSILEGTNLMVSPDNLQTTMRIVVRVQQERMENRQWTWTLFQSKKKVRDTVNTIFKLVMDSSALVSTGMSLAPPYVSIPWSAISALVPLLMNNATEQQASIDGLKSITSIMFSYRIAEETFLTDSELHGVFFEAVLPLYTKILEYQAAAANYFGMNTLKRLGRDVFAGGTWSDALAAVKDAEANSGTSAGFLGNRQRRNEFEKLLGILNEQNAQIEKLPVRLSSQQAETTQILQWASQIPHYSDHCEIKDNIGDVKEQWLLKEPAYLHWRGSDSGVLFLQGTVGKGKTSLVSGVVEDIFKQANSKIAFFYCSRTSSSWMGENGAAFRNDAVNIFRSIMAQFSLLSDGASLSPPLLNSFASSYHKIPGGCTMNLDDCIAVIKDVFGERPEALWTLIIDALDECKNPQKLLDALESLLKSNSRIKVMISSREGNRSSIDKHFPLADWIKIEEQNAADIEHYVRKAIQKRAGDVGLTDIQAARLENILKFRAQGMFRWVVLKLDTLLPRDELFGPRLPSDIDSQLDKLESSQLDGLSDLTATYHEIFNNATGNGQAKNQYEVICAALQWILSAFRSMTARELAYASSIRVDRRTAESVTETFILKHCANLLVERKNGVVRLAHLSVGEFLSKSLPDQFDKSHAHTTVSIACILFRKSPASYEIATHLGSARTETQCQHAPRAQPQAHVWDEFSAYTSAHWYRHCRQAFESNELTDLLPEIKSTMSVHDAIRKGDYDDLRARISRKADLSALDIEGYTLLHEAVRLQDATALQILIQAGSPIDITDSHGNSPLHTAASSNDCASLDVLLRGGAERDTRDSRGATPLHVAVYHNHNGAMRTLIAHGAQTSASDMRGNTPLHFASVAGLSKASQMLILSGCSLSTKNNNGETPLHCASRAGAQDIVRLLLEKGAKSDNNGSTPSKIALEAGHGELTRLIEDFNRLSPPISRPLNVPPSSTDFEVVSGQLCSYCNIVGWLCGSSRGIKHAHQPSFSALLSSAEQGCELCGYFAKGLTSVSKESLEVWETEIWVEVSLVVDRAMTFDGKDTLKVSLGTITEYVVELCLDRDDINWPLFSGRAIPVRSDSPACFSLIEEWIRECRENHTECKTRTQPLEASQLPTWLVDVESEQGLHLVRGEHLAARADTISYGFLSHLWGKSRFRNLGRRLMEDPALYLPYDALEQSLQDAVEILRKLDIRYLWVDKLCIKWEPGARTYERARQTQYIIHAALVINTGTRADKNGIYGPRASADDQLQLKCNLSLPDGQSVSSALHFRKPTRSAPEAFSDDVLSRAWMIQEVTLSRRVILYGHDQLYWKCHSVMRTEGNLQVNPPILDLGRIPEIVGDQVRTDRDFFDQWYRMVEIFSPKGISNFWHRLIAVAGMAEKYRREPLDASYSEGLWHKDIHRGLLWYARVTHDASRPRDSESTRASYRPDLNVGNVAPSSLSWASLRGAISYSLRYGLGLLDIELPVVEIPGITNDGNRTQRLIVRSAQSKELLQVSESENCQILFDTMTAETDWRNKALYTGILINTWSVDRSNMDSRWVGLVLEKVEPSKDLYSRVGLLLGPWLEDDMSEWHPGDFRII